MKAIVANLILGSTVSMVSSGMPVWADVRPQNQISRPTPAILSATALSYNGFFAVPPAFLFESQELDYFVSLEDKEYVKHLVEWDIWSQNQDVSNSALDIVEREFTNLRSNPYLQDEIQENLVLGAHKTFWHGEDEETQKYWGLTTIKTWGDGTVEELSLSKLNYLNSAPLLAPHSSALTVSGGSSQGLKKHNTQIEEVSDFNGGVAFHQSLANEVTVGLGFVYEDFLLGFSQLTYQPTNFPLRTTVSLLQKEDGFAVHSHLKLQPSEKVVFNLYSDEKDQKFDFNWGVASGLTLTADGNSETDNLRAGAKIAVKHELFSLLAQAQLDNNNEIQWQVNSRLGSLQLNYATNGLKTDTEVKYSLKNSEESNFELALFVNNKNRERKETENNLTVWGWDIHSTKKMAKNNHLWEVNLGYGFGSEGEGAVAHVGAGLNPSLSLKLSYEEVSLVSDETRIKLQLTSH